MLAEVLALRIAHASIHVIKRMFTRMKTTTSFTSTISPELISWVDKRARSQKRTRRVVLEEAIRSFQREATKNVLREGLARAAHDADILELIEWGMDDYRQLVGRA